ncbi:hypothetical protein STSV1pORF14 [Sulfolobus virus STSV1]|uniref:hypothetical protein n=1 Tax=Sulfolobus virus STSV1 TaxID=285013 RepID=UPI000042B0FC|nr:hypothetical protein STSV1pORF14 [Sulfolobus virus STSV1]CAH04197.1 hypothetical protein [Sulfolobus virus STSV1]
MSEPIFEIDENVEALKKLKYREEGEQKEQSLTKLIFKYLNNLNSEQNVAMLAYDIYEIILIHIVPELNKLLSKAYRERNVVDMLAIAADVYASLEALKSVVKLAADSSTIRPEEKERILRPIKEFIDKSHHLIETAAKYYYPQDIYISSSEFTGLQEDVLALKEAIDKVEQRLKDVEGGAIPDWKLIEEEGNRNMVYFPPRVIEHLVSTKDVLELALMEGKAFLSKYFAEPLLKFFGPILKKNNQDFSEHMSLLFPPAELIQAYRQALNEIKQRYDEMVRYALKLNEDNRNFAGLINDLANIYADAFAINQLGLLFCLPQKYSICTADLGIISSKIASTAQEMIENAAKHYYRR